MEAQRQRGTFGGSGEKAVADLWPALQSRLGETAFLGYEGNGHEGEGTVVALVKDGREVPELRAGDRGALLTDRTPFYGESGGQVGDTGRIVGHGGKTEAQVRDAQRPVPGLVVHEVEMTSGTLRTGDMVQLSVDGQRRNAIRANHSATHLLHRALKMVLGDHVKQAGFGGRTRPPSLRLRPLLPAHLGAAGAGGRPGQRLDPRQRRRRDEGHGAGRGEEGRRGGTVRREVRRAGTGGERAPPVDRALRRDTRPAHRGHRSVQDHLRGRHRLGRAAHRGAHRAGRDGLGAGDGARDAPRGRAAAAPLRRSSPAVWRRPRSG